MKKKKKVVQLFDLQLENFILNFKKLDEIMKQQQSYPQTHVNLNGGREELKPAD